MEENEDPNSSGEIVLSSHQGTPNIMSTQRLHLELDDEESAKLFDTQAMAASASLSQMIQVDAQQTSTPEPRLSPTQLTSKEANGEPSQAVPQIVMSPIESDRKRSAEMIEDSDTSGSRPKFDVSTLNPFCKDWCSYVQNKTYIANILTVNFCWWLWR